MSTGQQAQLKQMMQQRAKIRDYQAAKQQVQVNQRNQAVAILDAQYAHATNPAVIQRQLQQQEQLKQQQIAQRDQAVGLLQQKTLQQQQQQQQQLVPQQGFYPGAAPNMMNAPGMQYAHVPGGMNAQGGGMMMMGGMMTPNGMMVPGMMPQMMQPNMMGMPYAQSGMMAAPAGYFPSQQMPQMVATPQTMMNGSPAQPISPVMTSQHITSNTQPAASQALPQVYTEPEWSRPAQHRYQLRLVENGAVSYVDLVGRQYFIVGRHETCAIQLDNASVSRQHAVIQHRGGGMALGADEIYIYDLNSTSCTYLNGQPLLAMTYYALQPGDVINFGSAPPFVLCGGPTNFQPPLPVVTAPLPVVEDLKKQANTAYLSKQDSMDAFIHAKCSDHLVASLKRLDLLFEQGTILDEEYYKKKALIQDQMQRQQDEMRLKLKQKKKEARDKQYFEDSVSQQKAKQANLQSALIDEKVQYLVSGPSVAPTSTPLVATPLPKAATPSVSAPSTITSSTPAPLGGVSSRPTALDKIFTTSTKSATSGKAAKCNMATIKMDPRSPDFDAVAYKRMMLENYERQAQENTIRLRLKKLGDPASPEFNPEEYKRLMIEKYEMEHNAEEINRRLLGTVPQ